tara:strand:+ start:214 stop:477 length:264 start_codon:yes stop_codon:yes gene_type:complete
MGKVEKFWNGSTNFTVTETFPSVSAALKQTIPSDAAVYEVDGKTISFEFTRIKEVSNDKPLRTPGKQNPGKTKGEEKLEHKNNKNVK